jgi:plasmid segregation protein ParM
MAEKKAAAGQQPVPVIVAVDDGYAYTKVWRMTDGKPQRLAIPTVIKSGLHLVTGFDGTAQNRPYETEGRKFTADPSLVGEDTRFDGFHLSALNRVAVHHGLHLAGLVGQEVTLVAGLPVGDFFRDGIRNADLVERKKANLAVPVESFVPGAAHGRSSVRIAKATICAQAAAAWVDRVYDESLARRPDIEPDAAVGVVDVGGRTTDITVVLGGRAIDQGRSATENVGVLDINARLDQLVRKQFEFDEPLPAALYERAVATGSITLFGQAQDVSELVRQAISDVDQRIERLVRRMLGSAAELQKVVFVGGGAELLKALAGRYRNGEVPDDPSFANARGMWKYAALTAA